MKKKSTIVCGIVVLALCSIPVFADGPLSSRGTGECRYGCQDQQGSLTAEQQAELRELRQEYADQTRDLRESLWKKRQEMRTLMAGSSPDAKDLRQVQAEMNALRTQLGDARIDHMLKVKKVYPQAFSGRGGGYGYHAWRDGKRPHSRALRNYRNCPNAL